MAQFFVVRLVIMNNLPMLFTNDEVIKNFDSQKQLANWLALAQKNSKIKRIRNGLYAVVDPITKSSIANKFQIASKVSPSAFVAYHSALEYYGLANQVFGEVTVGSLVHFNNFQFEGIDYNLKKENNDKFVVNVANEHIKVTSRERTIVDCIDNITLSGGIEEVLNAMNQIKVVSTAELLKVLADKNEIFLYQKTGYLLEFFKEQMSLPEFFFQQCKSKITKKARYFLHDEFKEVVFNGKWNLIAPINPLVRIYGGVE